MPAPSVAADVEWRECAALLRDDFASFAVWCFRELNPRAPLAMNWHVEVMAGKLAAVREGRIRRLMVCVPPGHLKSHLASILVSGLVPGPRPERPDRLRQLRPGPCRQIVARLPAHRHERPVSAALFDTAVANASGGARVRDDGAGLSHRHLGRRGADRTRAINRGPAFLRL